MTGIRDLTKIYIALAEPDRVAAYAVWERWRRRFDGESTIFANTRMGSKARAATAPCPPMRRAGRVNTLTFWI